MSPSERAYRNLAAAARVEGGISPEERKLLNAYVLRLGLDAARARELEGDGGGFLVPEDAQERRETLRAVLELVAADGRIAPRELELARLLAGPRSSKELDLLWTPRCGGIAATSKGPCFRRGAPLRRR